MASPWVTSNSPCPEPWWPQVARNLPSCEYLTMRSLVFSPWPSAMKMSPFGATRTSDGPLSSSWPLPATPGLPSVISTRPSGLNLIAVSPLPLPAWPSVTQTLPSRSMPSPCGQLIRPRAEAHHLPAGGIEFLDRRNARSDAGFAAAAIEDPKARAVAVDVDADRHVPTSGLRAASPNVRRRDTDLARCSDRRPGPGWRRSQRLRQQPRRRGPHKALLVRLRAW